MKKVVVWSSKKNEVTNDKNVDTTKITDINLDTIASKISNTIWWENDRLVINNEISSIDIIEIHNMIRDKIKTIDKIMIKANRMKKMADEIKFMIEKKNLYDKYDELMKRVKYLKELENYYVDYCNVVKPLLIEYKNLSPDKTVFFGKDNIKFNEDKIQVIKNYLCIIKKFIDFDIIIQQKADNICLDCNTIICALPITTSIITCPNCNKDKIIYSNTEVYKTKNNDNCYEDITNFSKTLMRFQGKQKVKFGNELYNKLDNYFIKIKKPISEEIKKLPLLLDGKKEGTNYSMLYAALFETGNSGHYEDANLIAHYYWGWALPELHNSMEKMILDHYTLTQKVFRNMSIDIRGRKSSLNTQYRLYKHLQLVGYPCSIIDFKIPDTNDVIESYDETWEKMCNDAGLEFIPTK
jgi:hypothetical protein